MSPPFGDEVVEAADELATGLGDHVADLELGGRRPGCPGTTAVTVAPARSLASSAVSPSQPWVTFPLDSIWSCTSSAILIGTARPVVVTPGGLVRIPTSSPFVLNRPPPEVSGASC